MASGTPASSRARWTIYVKNVRVRGRSELLAISGVFAGQPRMALSYCDKVYTGQQRRLDAPMVMVEPRRNGSSFFFFFEACMRSLMYRSGAAFMCALDRARFVVSSLNRRKQWKASVDAAFTMSLFAVNPLPSKQSFIDRRRSMTLTRPSSAMTRVSVAFLV